MPPVADSWEALVDRALALVDSGRRHLLGVTGPPGAGKSTLAHVLADHLLTARPGCVVVVPMDGFHLAQSSLIRLGRAGRKGAPDTFDAGGYLALLQRLRAQRLPAWQPPGAPENATVWAPTFRRDLEEPIAGAIAVDPVTPLVVTEGNYLLSDGAFVEVAGLLDEVWYVEADPADRYARLLARHRAGGRRADAAQAWVRQVDEPNTRLVAATRGRAHLIVPSSIVPPA